MVGDITNLCFEIEHKLETFELSSSIKVETIHIERNAAGEITAVRATTSGEYRNPNR
jgi:hypothetical protein